MGFKLIKDRFAAIEPYVRGKAVLDVGCVDARPDGRRKYKSTGLHIFLNERARELMGVDCDSEGIQSMKEDGYNCAYADAETMNLERKFDCIVAGEVIEHLSNPGFFLENMRRHLADGGFLILTTPNAFGIVNFYRILTKNAVKVHGGHTCWYDQVTITQLLLRHCFSVKEAFFSNKRKWYKKRYFYKLKYQIPKLLSGIRPYFSGTLVVVAKKAG